MNVMVCVTIQRTCKRLIHKAKQLLNENGGQLYVVHVAAKGTAWLGANSDAEALDFLYTTARDNGAEMSILRSADTVKTLIKFINQHKITDVVMGEAAPGQPNIVYEGLYKRFPSVNYHIVPVSGYEPEEKGAYK